MKKHENVSFATSSAQGQKGGWRKGKGGGLFLARCREKQRDGMKRRCFGVYLRKKAVQGAQHGIGSLRKREDHLRA